MEFNVVFSLTETIKDLKRIVSRVALGDPSTAIMELKNVLTYNNQLLLNGWLETYVTGQHKSLSVNCLFEQKLTRGTHPLSHQASDNVVT